MWVQFEDGNKTRAGSINIATLPHWYTDGTSNNIISVQTNMKSIYLAVLCDQATVRLQYGLI